MRSPIHKGGINTSDKSCLPSTKLPPPKMHYFKAIPIITETKDRHWDRHLTVTMLEGFQLNVICWCRHLIVTYIWFPQAEISFCHGHPLSTHLSCNISVAVRQSTLLAIAFFWWAIDDILISTKLLRTSVTVAANYQTLLTSKAPSRFARSRKALERIWRGARSDKCFMLYDLVLMLHLAMRIYRWPA